MQQKVCRHCGSEFRAIRANVLYCSDTCKMDSLRARKKAEHDALRAARRCAQCGGTVPFEFSLQARFCSDTCREKAWGDRHRDRYMYGYYRFSKNQYDAQLVAQGGVCAICGSDQPGKTKAAKNRRFAIDHNHETKEVRGLLCHHCNVALGYMRDDPDILRRAIDYLADPPARRAR